MEDKQILDALTAAKKEAKKRNFAQKIDMIINLKDLDLKKNENHVDFFTQLHYSIGKNVKICALCGPELMDEAKKVCDKAIPQSDFPDLAKDKKAIKKIVDEYDYFIAQANIMAQVAQTFGKVLGPRGKMPNPKAGCVVPPKASLQPLYDKLQTTVRISAKKDPVIHLLVGSESMKDEELVDNVKTAFNQLVHHLPGEQNNIKDVFVKLTMGKPVKLL